MGAINETYLKMMDYHTPMIHMLFPRLAILLEYRRITVVGSPAHGETVPITVEYLERINNEILELLSIPIPEKGINKRPDSIQEQEVMALERSRKMLREQLNICQTALKEILDRIYQDLGKSIGPEMVQTFFQDVANIANAALKPL